MSNRHGLPADPRDYFTLPSEGEIMAAVRRLPAEFELVKDHGVFFAQFAGKKTAPQTFHRSIGNALDSYMLSRSATMADYLALGRLVATEQVIKVLVKKRIRGRWSRKAIVDEVVAGLKDYVDARGRDY